MTVLTELANLAEKIDSGESTNGSSQWLELAVENSNQLSEIIQRAASHNIVIIRGKSDERVQRLNRAGLETVFLNLSKMSKIVEHVRDDQVITVESGIALHSLQSHLLNHGQWLPLEFISENTTLADVIDTGDGGFLETFCGVKQLVLGMHAALADGESIKTGGKIVKNVTGYDLSKLLIGSRGWLAVPYMVHLRLYSLPEENHLLVVCAEKPQDLIALSVTLSASGLPLFCLETFDTRLPEFCLAEAQSQAKAMQSGRQPTNSKEKINDRVIDSEKNSKNRQGTAEARTSQSESSSGGDETSQSRSNSGSGETSRSGSVGEETAEDARSRSRSISGSEGKSRSESKLIGALEELTKMTKGHRCALLVATRGHHSVVKEVVSSLRAKIEACGFSAEVLSEDSRTSIERLCSSLLISSQYETLEFNMPASVMMHLFQTWWLQEGKPPWCARVASGRLKIGIQDDLSESASIFGFAETELKNGLEPFTLAYPTERFEFKVSRLPKRSDAAFVDKVLSRLKSKFDPQNLLNPLVQFHSHEVEAGIS